MKKTILASAIIAAAAFNPQISQAASLETRQAGVATAGVLARRSGRRTCGDAGPRLLAQFTLPNRWKTTRRPEIWKKP